MQVVTYLGYLLGGWRVSALITAAFAAALLMRVLAAAHVRVTAQPALRPAVQGLTAVVVGIMFTTTYRLGKANIKKALTLGIALAACLVGAFLSIHTALLVTIAGLLGSVVLAAPQQEGKP